uniref:Uncharacterized protein n=1 Tax=Cacopsylla melanoneura TaxID=428564 RepID=A0A8D8UYP4_9HEMI
MKTMVTLQIIIYTLFSDVSTRCRFLQGSATSVQDLSCSFLSMESSLPHFKPKCSVSKFSSAGGSVKSSVIFVSQVSTLFTISVIRCFSSSKDFSPLLDVSLWRWSLETDFITHLN